MSSGSWHDKLIGGFKRTSDRLIGNLAGLGGARLERHTLDAIEEALIASGSPGRARSAPSLARTSSW